MTESLETISVQATVTRVVEDPSGFLRPLHMSVYFAYYDKYVSLT